MIHSTVFHFYFVLWSCIVSLIILIYPSIIVHILSHYAKAALRRVPGPLPWANIGHMAKALFAACRARGHTANLCHVSDTWLMAKALFVVKTLLCVLCRVQLTTKALPWVKYPLTCVSGTRQRTWLPQWLYFLEILYFVRRELDGHSSHAVYVAISPRRSINKIATLIQLSFLCTYIFYVCQYSLADVRKVPMFSHKNAGVEIT